MDGSGADHTEENVAAFEAILSIVLATPTRSPRPVHRRSSSVSALEHQAVEADSDSITDRLIMTTITEIQSFAPTTPSHQAQKSDKTPSTSGSSPKMNGTSIISDVKSDPEFKINRIKAMLEMATLEKEVVEMAALLNEKVAIVQGLQGAVDGEAEALLASIASLRREQAIAESTLRRAEENKQNFVMAVAMDNGDIDRVNLRKAELDIMKLKASIFEKEIQVMEEEMRLKAYQDNIAKGNPEISDAQAEVDSLEEKLQGLKSNLEQMNESYELTYGEAADPVVAELTKQIRALKVKNEGMAPLWYIGHATRNRYLEGEMKVIHGRFISREVDFKCFEAYKLGKAVADATMYLEFSDGRRGSVDEFKSIYGVEAVVVWEHRNFESFINMLNWMADMRKFARMNPGFKFETFNEHYNELLPKIYPGFDVNSDEQIKNDEEMFNHYLALQADHDQARSNNRNTGNGPNPRNSSQPARGFYNMERRSANRN